MSSLLLPPQSPQHQGRATLLLDLDNTLMSASLEYGPGFEFKGSDGTVWQAVKRPGVDDFLAQMAALFEVVVFTSSNRIYADNALNRLDTSGCIVHRLYGGACRWEWDDELGAQVKVKDLKYLGRDLNRVVAVDDDPLYYSHHPLHVIGILPFKGDPADRELQKLAPLLTSIAHEENIPSALLIHRNHVKEKELLTRDQGASTHEQTSADEHNTDENTKTGASTHEQTSADEHSTDEHTKIGSHTCGDSAT